MFSWMMEHGTKEKLAMYKQAKAAGLKTPLHLKPKTDILSQYVIKHFQRLSRGRSTNGFGYNPLNITDILNYSEKLVTILPLEFVLDIFQDLDSIYLKIKSDEIKSTQNKKVNPQNKRARHR